MREKACDLIYLNTKKYISFAELKTMYWKLFIIPFSVFVIGIAEINKIGVSYKSLFPIVSVAIWSLLYWIFVLKIENKLIKKTFELRFLVNGVSSLLLSSLFWIFFTSFNLVSKNSIAGFDFCLLLLLFYLIFSVTYVALIIFGVHKGAFKKIREKGKTDKILALDAFFASLIPLSGVAGMISSRLLRSHADVSTQNIAITICGVFIIFAPALAHINFVQYFYCKKYKISCDEDGCTTSDKLQ